MNLACCALLVLSVIPGEEDFLAGWQAEQQGRYADAIPAYARAAAVSLELRPYALIQRARIRIKAGDAAGAEQEFKHLIALMPEGPWVRMAQAHLGRLLLELKRPEEAVALLRNATNVQPQPWWMEEFARAAAEAMAKLPGAQAEAWAYFRKTVQDTLYVKKRVEAARWLLGSALAEDKAVAIAGLLRSGELGEAGKALLAASAPALGAHATAAPAGVVQQIAPKGATVETLEKTVAELAQTPLMEPWLPLWLAYGVRSLGGDKDTRAAAVLLAGVLATRYGGATETGDTLWWLAQKCAGAGDAATAAALYLRLVETCPKHFRADDALFEVARLQTAQGTTKEAEQTILRLAADFPDSRFLPEALYRAAGLETQNGNLDRAKAFYTQAGGLRLGDFYAHRALERLRELGMAPQTQHNLRLDGVNPVLDIFSMDVAPPRPLPAFVHKSPRINRLFFFGQHGIDAGEWEALDLLLQLRRELNPNIFYRVVAEAGFAHTALQFAVARGWGVAEGKPTLDRLRLEFPRAYWPQVQALAQETGVDPYLILAVAKQESTFRAGIQSSAGATGVMQLMPGTAAWLAKVEDNITEAHVSDLKSPENSIRLGAYYLMRMVDRSNQNLIFATASYNAGPGNNEKWRKRFGGYAVDEFIEAIPYEETKGYVKKVLGNYAAYRTLYPESKQVAQATE